MPRLASLMTLALVACLLGACANVHLAGPYNQRVDRDEVSSTEFAMSVLMDALFGGWRDAPGRR